MCPSRLVRAAVPRMTAHAQCWTPCCLLVWQVLAKLPLLQQLSVKGAPLAAAATHREELLVGGPHPGLVPLRDDGVPETLNWLACS
jgi:hypothetical protein